MLLERAPGDTQGPPFSVPPAELETLYGDAFAIEWVGREAATHRTGPMTEHVAVLTPR
jgi:hypothetical protein